MQGGISLMVGTLQPQPAQPWDEVQNERSQAAATGLRGLTWRKPFYSKEPTFGVQLATFYAPQGLSPLRFLVLGCVGHSVSCDVPFGRVMDRGCLDTDATHETYKQMYPRCGTAIWLALAFQNINWTNNSSYFSQINFLVTEVKIHKPTSIFPLFEQLEIIFSFSFQRPHCNLSLEKYLDSKHSPNKILTWQVVHQKVFSAAMMLWVTQQPRDPDLYVFVSWSCQWATSSFRGL